MNSDPIMQHYNSADLQWILSDATIHNSYSGLLAKEYQSKINSKIQTDSIVTASEKTFAVKSLASRHQRESTKIFNIEAYCEICQKEFCNKYYLQTHRKAKHDYNSNSLSALFYSRDDIVKCQGATTMIGSNAPNGAMVSQDPHLYGFIQPSHQSKIDQHQQQNTVPHDLQNLLICMNPATLQSLYHNNMNGNNQSDMVSDSGEVLDSDSKLADANQSPSSNASSSISNKDQHRIDESSKCSSDEKTSSQRTEDEMDAADSRFLQAIYSNDHNANSHLPATGCPHPIIGNFEANASQAFLAQPNHRCSNNGPNSDQSSRKRKCRTDTVEGAFMQQPPFSINSIPMSMLAYSSSEMYFLSLGAFIAHHSLLSHPILSDIPRNALLNPMQQAQTSTPTSATTNGFQDYSRISGRNAAADNGHRFASDQGSTAEHADCAVTCPVCNQAFDNAINLCSHIKQYHQASPTIPNNTRLAVRRRDKEKAPRTNESLEDYVERYCHICDKDVCNKYFAAQHMWQMHKLIVDPEKMKKTSEELIEQGAQYMCMQCRDSKFETELLLRHHRSNFHKECRRSKDGNMKLRAGQLDGQQVYMGGVTDFSSQCPNESWSDWCYAAYKRFHSANSERKVTIMDEEYRVNVPGSSAVGNRKCVNIRSPPICDIEAVNLFQTHGESATTLYKKPENNLDDDVAIDLSCHNRTRKTNSDFESTNTASLPSTSRTLDNSPCTSTGGIDVENTVSSAAKVATKRRGRKSSTPNKVKVVETHQVTDTELSEKVSCRTECDENNYASPNSDIQLLPDKENGSSPRRNL